MKQISLFILSIVCIFSCNKKQEKTNAIEERITESVYASGVIKSKNQYQVFSTVNGLVKQVLVTEGTIIKKGDPLYKISNDAIQLNNENAIITAKYGSLSSNTDKLNELKLDIETAKVKTENDASLLDKQQNLWDQGIGTRNELEVRQLNLKNSTNAYHVAQLRYKQIENQLTLQAKQTQKLLDISNTVKGDYTIKSEFNGKVYTVLKKQGEMVNTQSPIALVGEANGFILELQVDEYDITRIKIGQQVILNMDSYKNQVFEAIVTKIYPAMNASSKSFTIEASFTKAPAALYPNLTTEANIVIKTKEKAITIPRSYIIDDEFVLLENNKKRKVVIGLKDYQKVEIISGLTIKDIIVKQAE